EGVAHISDPILREGVVRNVSTRLEITPAQFLALLDKKPRTRQYPTASAASTASVEGEANAGTPAPEERPPNLSPTLQLLCQLLLISPEAHAWVKGQPYHHILSALPDGEYPTFLLDSSYQAGAPASLAAFLAT